MNLAKYQDLLKSLEIESKDPSIQMTVLYAFEEIYDGDPNSAPDVIDKMCPGAGSPIVTVLFNYREGDDGAVEVFIGYAPNPDRGFDLSELKSLIQTTLKQIDNIKNKRFISTNKKSDSVLADVIDEANDPEIKKILPIKISVVTTATANEKAVFDIQKEIRGLDLNLTGQKVYADIVFPDAIDKLIESNSAPFDFVKDAILEIDEEGNRLSFGDNALICNVSAKSLAALYDKEGNRGLLAMNLRYYVKSQTIDDKIVDSILNAPDNFWFYNNGITIVCDDFSFSGKNLKLHNFSIVNGGQTTNRIGNTPFDKDFYLSCKIVKNTFENADDKNRFVSEIADATNSQKPINAKDRIANRPEQRKLKADMAKEGVFVEIKRGDKANRVQFPEVWQKTRNNTIAQDLFSFVYAQPGTARNSVSSVLQNDKFYKKLFLAHQYDPKFLKDLVTLEKAFVMYQRKMKKRSDIEPEMDGLIKNGLFYSLATIGFILKLGYNPGYRNTLIKYSNAPDTMKLISSEQAFNHPFLKPLGFKEQCLELERVFDFLFNAYGPIYTEFKKAKMERDIAYSNWMKNNIGFDAIRNSISQRALILNDWSWIDAVMSRFLSIDQAQMETDADLFAGNIKKIERVGKSSQGVELDERDQELRDALMTYRLKKSQEKHLPESKIFTDKKLDRILMEKPDSKEDLKKIIGGVSFFYCGSEIWDILQPYL